MTDDLLQWRDEFPILDTCNYLISNSLGAMPRTVYDSLNDYADTWATQGVSAWGDTWWDLNREVSDAIAPLMGAPNGSITVHQNASIANSILFSALDFEAATASRRDKVVATDMDFPSDVYVLRKWLPDNMRVEMVKTHNDVTIDTDELLAAIDERTRLVSVSHVLFRSGYIMPAREIVQKAHSVGAEVVFNGYHSVGIIPVDVTALEVDYYIGGTLKWLCGGPGGVFMYVRPDLLPKLEPKVTGWFAHQQPFAFDIKSLDLREDAYRLMNGTPGIASLYAIQPGVEIIAEVGVDDIREKSMRQTALLYDLANKAGFTVKSPAKPGERGGMVVIDPPHAYEVSRALLAQNIVIDYRAEAGIRVAPHFYNSDDEIRQALAAMRDTLDSGDWQNYSGDRAFVT
jgi:kynureninase